MQLWTRAQPEVRRYVFMLVPRAADAEDVMQETATSLWEKFDQYDPRQPFVAWAIRFAHLEVLKWRQRQARDRLVFSDELLALLDVSITEEVPWLAVRRRALDGCLEQLPADQRGLLLRRYAEHGSVKTQAERSGVSVHRLYYAVEKIRTRLMECIHATLRREGWSHG
ncbi:MAG: sigma-70 family RNA polymerase sigma factor [Gemmataceae bacterium]